MVPRACTVHRADVAPSMNMTGPVADNETAENPTADDFYPLAFIRELWVIDHQSAGSTKRSPIGHWDSGQLADRWQVHIECC